MRSRLWRCVQKDKGRWIVQRSTSMSNNERYSRNRLHFFRERSCISPFDSATLRVRSFVGRVMGALFSQTKSDATMRLHGPTPESPNEPAISAKCYSRIISYHCSSNHEDCCISRSIGSEVAHAWLLWKEVYCRHGRHLAQPS